MATTDQEQNSSGASEETTNSSFSTSETASSSAHDKYCVSCRRGCAESDNFCPSCGKSYFAPTLEEAIRLQGTKYCVSCLLPVGKTVKYCTQCGGKKFADTPDKAAKCKMHAENKKEKAKAAAKRRSEFAEGLKESLPIMIPCLFVVTLCVLLVLFADLEWWQSQHVIGALGGGALTVSVFAIVFCVNGDVENSAFIDSIIFLCVVIVNTTLAFLLKDEYRIVSFWINGCLILSCIITFGFGVDKDNYSTVMLSLVGDLGAIGSIVAVSLAI